MLALFQGAAQAGLAPKGRELSGEALGRWVGRVKATCAPGSSYAGLHVYGLPYSYVLYCCVLHSRGLYRYELYRYRPDIVMAGIVMTSCSYGLYSYGA